MKVVDKKSHSATKIATHSISKRNACLLAALYHLNKNQRTTFLRGADEKLIRCICECVFNTLEGNVSLERCEKNQLTKYKTPLRRIVAKRGNWKDKRKLLVQRGGFLPYIIGPILSTLLSLIIESTK
ncbi:hypothetical protein ALC57_01002 [Trachymyrmex cornetzi]|uniref:Uncharacterized protein n=1 Tax=Trachymyrmex cornetzi TaxID=471704 RepID=A0A151K3F1_9HYME|nr:hypothetical protein ALC57_01002 [Trachymyrmex cornetzi]